MRRVRQYKIGIYDTDIKYLLKLIDYINQDMHNPILALGFTTEEKLLEYLKEHQLDLLLLAENVEMISNEKCGEILYLRTDKEQAERIENSIYKYSRADHIVQQIVRTLKVENGGMKKALYHTYGVISPVGRSGKTRLAKALCTSDEVRGGLYLGMEEYGSVFFESVEEENSMSNILFLVKSRSQEFLSYLEDVLIKIDDIYMIPSPASYLDLRSLTKDDVRWMLEMLVQWGRFTTIACDIGGSALADLSILEAFDHLMMPVLGDDNSTKKVERFIKLLERKELGKLASGIQKVHLPDVDYNEPAMLGYLEQILEREQRHECRG